MLFQQLTCATYRHLQLFVRSLHLFANAGMEKNSQRMSDKCSGGGIIGSRAVFIARVFIARQHTDARY